MWREGGRRRSGDQVGAELIIRGYNTGASDIPSGPLRIRRWFACVWTALSWTM